MASPEPPAARMHPFLAIDFETSHYKRDSACCVGLVRVEAGEIVAREKRLIRPPLRPEWLFTSIHGIRRADVADAPEFREVWRSLDPWVKGVQGFVAHNASFDRSVLRACCAAAGIEMPALPFTCTVSEARDVWSLYPTRLPDVCRHLSISLKHHDALSDAEAAALIHVRAERERRR